MFDTIQALIEQKQPERPLLLRTWENLVEQLGPLDIRANISAYYHTEIGGVYSNIAILTTKLIIDLEANERTQLQRLHISELTTVGGVAISNTPDDLTEPISRVATGEAKRPTLVGYLLSLEGDEFLSWYATEKEEDELRSFIRDVSIARFSQETRHSYKPCQHLVGKMPTA